MKSKKEDVKTTRVSTGIYVRVSTEEQAQEGFSIRAQIEKLKSYAMLKEWDIHDIYADEGISGKNIVDRPAINRLIDDIQNEKVNNVLVYKVDRLTRSTKNLIELVELFEECGCAFNSLTESIDTATPSGRMFLKIIGIFAEFERENMSERSRLGRERKVKEGYTIANYSLSYGYAKKKGEKIQDVLPDEAQIVKEIFSLYVNDNMSMSGIARLLNKRGLKTKRNAVAWDSSTVKNILTNPTYIGKVRYSLLDENKYFEVEGQHERIITDELFYLAQEKIKNMPKFSKTKKPKEANYFCGVLTCGLCGSRFTTHNQLSRVDEKGKNVYKGSYRCNKKQKYHYPEDIVCKCPDISHAKVEVAFSEYIKKIGDFSEIENINTDDTGAQKELELLAYISECEKKMNGLQVRKKTLMTQYVKEEISFEDYKDMLSILNESLDTLKGELQRTTANIKTVEDESDISKEDIILNLKENWDYLDNNERMTFLQRFVNKIVITVEKEHTKSSVAKIEDIQFNSGLTMRKDRKPKVRGILHKER